MLPTKPSQTTTSAAPFGRSLASILPMKFRPLFSKSSVVSLTCLFPFPASAPTLSRATLGLSDPKEGAGKDVSYRPEAQELLGPAVNICTEIKYASIGSDAENRSAECGSLNTACQAQYHGAGGHSRAGRAHGDAGVRVTLSNHASRYKDRRPRLLSQGESRGLFLGYHPFAGYDSDRQARCIIGTKLGLDGFRVSYEHYLSLTRGCELHRTPDYL